jgi:acyl carrier protein
MNQEVIDLLAEALEVEPSLLNADTKIAELPEWTSLAWLTMMAMVDEKFGIQLSATEIRGFKTVQGIIDTIQARIESGK